MSVDRTKLTTNLAAALAAAAAIATATKNNPSLWAAPDIEKWNKEYVKSVQPDEGASGYFLSLLDDFKTDGQAPSKTGALPWPEIPAADLDVVAPGATVGSAAVLSYLDFLRVALAPEAFFAFWKQWDAAIAVSDGAAIIRLYRQGPCTWFAFMQTVFNTMARRMDQGTYPVVAGPGDVVVHTPMGDYVTKKSATVGDMLIVDLCDLLARYLPAKQN